MLLELFRSLADGFPALNVFNYLTLRAVLAALTSMGIGFALGPWMIARLKNLHFGQAVRTDGPKTHLVKDGTPTMGGALILFAITVSTLLWADLSNRFIWVVLFVTLGYGSIGWIDDYRKVVHHNPKGMSAREKFSWQSVIGLAAAFYLVFALSVPAGGTLTETIAGWVEAGFPLDISSNLHLLIPCFKDIALPLGLVGFMVFTYVVIVGSSNAVNLTDGLDGLAILPSVMVGGALGIKPVLALKDGEIKLVDKGRGRPGALVAMFKQLDALGGIDPRYGYTLLYSDNKQLIAPVHHYMHQNLQLTGGRVAQLGPTIGTHVGPGVVGVVFVAKE